MDGVAGCGRRPIGLEVAELRAIAEARADTDVLCAVVLDSIGRVDDRVVHIVTLSPSGCDAAIVSQAGGPARSFNPLETVEVQATGVALAARVAGDDATAVLDRDGFRLDDLERFLRSHGAHDTGPVAISTITDGSAAIGFLRLSGPADHAPFTEDECARLDGLADAIAIPVAYRRSAGLRARSEDAQSALAAIGDEAHSTSTLDDFLAFAASASRVGAAADWVGVFTLPADGSVRWHCSSGLEAASPAAPSFALDRLGRELLADDAVRSWSGPPDDAPSFAAAVPGTGALLVVQLCSNAGPWGFLVAGRSGLCRFDRGAEQFFSAAGHLLNKVIIVRNLMDRLRHEASTDELTGLPNRAALRRGLRAGVDAASARGCPLTLMIADLDGFKVVNDSLGHAAGDELLRVVADRLRVQTRPEDLVARLGGDEFALLCLDTDERDAMALAGRLLTALREPVGLGTSSVSPRVSIGVAICYPTAAHGYDDDLLLQADLAMYRAKNGGRDRVAVYDRALHEGVQRRLDLEQGLHDAIERDQLSVEYQPVVRIADDRIVAFEALVRWRHPVLGLVRPDQFIEVAEEAGIITELDLWVLRAASRQAVEWHASGLIGPEVQMAVNVSARDLVDHDFAERFRRVLAATGCSPSWMQAEVTETLLTEEAGVDTVRALAALGVGIALDDYGTGFSSLAQLKRVPVDVIKIDRAFVGGLTTDPIDSAIVASTINLAHALGKVVVAEGVETVEQLERLRQLGCDKAQGYLYARPASAADIVERLRRGWGRDIGAGPAPGGAGPKPEQSR